LFKSIGYSDCYTNKLFKFQQGLRKLLGPVSVLVPPGKISLGGPAYKHLYANIIAFVSKWKITW